MRSFILIATLIISTHILAQTYNNPGGTINTCSGTFFDTGGAGGNYTNDQNITTTFCSNAGNCIAVNFTQFQIENGWDFLSVYDGPSTASNLLGTFTGTAIPAVIVSTTGCLTFQFISDFSITNPGWAASIVCIPCPTAPDYTQPITANAGGEKVGACLVANCGPSTYTDNGGFSGDYSNNISAGGYSPNNAVYRVFCPDAANQCMQVTFNSFVTANNFDVMWVRNGPTEFSPNFTGPPTQTTQWPSPPNAPAFDDGLFGNLNGATPFSFTSTDPSGCLTFAFLTSGVNVAAGWDAVLQCVPCAGGPNGTDNNDCPRATPICGTANVASNSTGPGIVAEGCSYGTCPAGGENNTNWFTFTVSFTGSLDILLTPTIATDDYDFAVYGPNVTCGALGAPLRCSDSGNTGSTGIGGDTDFTEDVNGNSFVQSLNVTIGESYMLVIDEWTTSGSGGGYQLSFGGTALLDCTILPVELSEFTVEYAPEFDVVDLYWETESERDNDRFEVEKSTDGINFEVFHTVKGVGNSNYTSQYYSVDPNPTVGTNYYRLNQFDIDGKSKYSEIRSVNILSDDYDMLSVFPNPTSGITEVIFNTYSKQSASLKVMTNDGRVIVNTSLDVVAGGNRFDLDLTEYSQGLYFIAITTAEKTYTTKLFKK